VGERKGSQWTSDDYRNWRVRKFQAACVAVGLGVVTKTEDGERSWNGMKPYDLRHYAGSMWLHERNDPVIVARWMGHSLKVFLDIYAHVIAELGEPIEDDGCKVGAEPVSETQSAQ
jgi:integrase